MKRVMMSAAAAALALALATPGSAGILLWQDDFSDASHWQLSNLSASENVTSVTFSATDPAVWGKATRLSSPELLPWSIDGYITNIVLEIVHWDFLQVAPEEVIALLVYADTYREPNLDPMYKIESKVIQEFSYPGEYVTYFSEFAWSPGPGGIAPGYVNFAYELIGVDWEEGMLFTADHFSYSIIPEPGTLLIGSLLAGLSGITLRRKRMKS